MATNHFPEKIRKIINDIIKQYLDENTKNRPWIIGFSGGKDSTVLLTLVWYALEKIRITYSQEKLVKHVYVVCNDTMVENPIISQYVDKVLAKIRIAAQNKSLPIYVKKTKPKIEETFWVNVIGKGYPVPNNTFRWCTEKLKIKPTSTFITDSVDEKGEAIILIGTRKDESQKRAQSIKKHEIKGKTLTKHSLHQNLLVYSPIKELSLEEIWFIINTIPSPWGADNTELLKIYSNANADDYECPTVVTDKSHKSCGQSRFGCWTCTVVNEDKSMTALIKNGEKWLLPLLQYRNKLFKERNQSQNRMSKRRNGQVAVTDDGHNQGSYTPEYRYRKLRELLELQFEIQKTHPYIELITKQELIAIQIYWYRDGIFNYNVGDLYSRIFYKNRIVHKNLIEMNLLEKELLRQVCNNFKYDIELINKLLILQSSKLLLQTNHNLLNDFEFVIEEFVKGENCNEN